MTPHYSDDWLTVYGGDCRTIMEGMPADSVDCVVTSPPYWGLRDYGSDGQLGLERTPEEYVANMVAVFREVRRVLKPSGTCWLNLGDSYAGNGKGDTYSGFNERYHGTTSQTDKQGQAGQSRVSAVQGASVQRVSRGSADYGDRLKPKDLVGIPWRVAFALQADGWYLRSDVIWSKPNPMPESVTDRPTKSHEYLFLLTKSARYYFDADAVREGAISGTDLGLLRGRAQSGDPGVAAHAPSIRKRQAEGIDSRTANPSGQRNIRSVWTIATRPYPGAHFAVFPPELPERCIKAGSPEHGLVLDPFAGSGTVGLVANRLSRRAILIDLNPEYLEQQMKRNAQTPLGLGAA